jgi:hypothetical protein
VDLLGPWNSSKTLKRDNPLPLPKLSASQVEWVIKQVAASRSAIIKAGRTQGVSEAEPFLTEFFSSSFLAILSQVVE